MNTNPILTELLPMVRRTVRVGVVVLKHAVFGVRVIVDAVLVPKLVVALRNIAVIGSLVLMTTHISNLRHSLETNDALDGEICLVTIGAL